MSSRDQALVGLALALIVGAVAQRYVGADAAALGLAAWEMTLLGATAGVLASRLAL